MIDLHCHPLPGIDDGPEDFEQSIALVRASAEAGAHTIVATPHVSWRYRNDPATIGALVAELNERVAAQGIGARVLPGAEIAATRVTDPELDGLGELALASSRWLLLEPPFSAVVTGFDQIAFSLMAQGHRLLIAHPERCPAFRRDPRVLGDLVRAGAATSITAGSLVGRFGEPVRRLAMSLIEQELAHNVASDAHDDGARPPGMAAEIFAAGLGEPLRRWLTET
ncbi:MAG: tyrosine-protein phosphatase, partial [Solirubrobacteraceae bacterium]